MRKNGYYSQNDEDVQVLNYFGNFKGTLLDLGANDGITLSNSRKLMEQGWQGVLVEASPITYKKLDHVYRNNHRATCINKGIGTQQGKFEFHDSGSHLGEGQPDRFGEVA